MITKNDMSHTEDEILSLWRESVRRQEKLVKEYRETHKMPSRGVIITPEIEKERTYRKQLYAEMLKLKYKK